MIMMTEDNDFDLYISMGEKNKFIDDKKELEEKKDFLGFI